MRVVPGRKPLAPPCEVDGPHHIHLRTLVRNDHADQIPNILPTRQFLGWPFKRRVAEVHLGRIDGVVYLETELLEVRVGRHRFELADHPADIEGAFVALGEVGLPELRRNIEYTFAHT